MPEKYIPHDEKDNSDTPDTTPKQPERHAWQSPESSGAAFKSWWHESDTPQIVPPSQEVRNYAAERQASKTAETSFGKAKENKDDEEDEEEQASSDRQNESSSKIQEKPTTSYTESEQPEEPEQEAVEAVETEATPQESEENVEAAKEIAREELEAYETSLVEDDPAVDYLEKVAEHGMPAEAEQEIIEEHDLSEVQAEANLLVQDLEGLLEDAAAKVGDRDLSYEEMTELAQEMIPEVEKEIEPSEIEAFAPEPSEPPEIITRPDLLKGDEDVLSTPTTRHNFYKPPVAPVPSGSGVPPIVPPGGGGGGGGGNGGANGLAGAAGALNPNMQPVWQPAEAAERVKRRKKTMSNALLAGLLGYYLGRHFGKKKGVEQKAAELEPRLEKQEKINKQQSAEIMAGQKRIDSLKRIKDAQEKETYERERRERFAAQEKPQQSQKEQLSSAENSVPPVARVEQLERTPSQTELEQMSVTPASIEQPAPILREQIETVPSTPSLSEAPLGVPELPQEQIIRPEAASTTQPQLERATGEHAIEQSQQPQSRELFESGTAPGLAEDISPLPSIESAQPEEITKPEAREPEQVKPVSSFRPEVATTTPGLEIPLPTGVPEAQPVSSENAFEPSQIEATPPPIQPEVFDAKVVEAMNMPELITVAKEMTVGGENLGQIFQEKKIDAAGLRRVVAEYARGGHPEQILAQEQQIMEMRHRSPEFLKSQTTTTQSDGAGTQGGGGGGLFAQTEQTTDHLLPAYDHEQYPSGTPQHLLPTLDQETISKKQHHIIIAAAGMIGLGAGIILGLLLL